jgi:hypothetical protein
MRAWARFACFALSLWGCAMSHEITPVVVDAARKATACEPIEITALKTSRYEVRGCGQTTYWVCASDEHDLTCCERVDTRARLMKPLFLLTGANKLCDVVGAEVPLMSY